MTLRVRFAPSPTGRLHVGNLYVALANWLHAARHGGAMILRFDDTDEQRSRTEFAEAIRADLHWLGLDWAQEAHQSQRRALYDAAADRLRASARLYPCYETAEELALRRKAQLQAGKPPVYDRAALALTDADRRRLEGEGRRPHWRFRLDHRLVEWDDLARGPERIDAASQSDPVLVREDGQYLYTLPTVVDDIDLGIGAVIRGHDHVTNTAAQIQIFEALGGAVPAFAHLPLLAGPDGQPLSKRLASLSIDQLRADGVEPLALAIYLGGIGSGAGGTPLPGSLAELARGFDIAHFGRGSPHFDPVALRAINKRVLHATGYASVADRLAPLGCDAPLWLTIRGNLERLADAAIWAAVCHGEIEPVIEEPDYLRQAAALLPPEPWTSETWSEWTAAIRNATGRKGRALFHPLRLALTGRESGPEMAALLPLIGRERALRRLVGGG
jgi:glutamyl-tRNA synthetase